MVTMSVIAMSYFMRFIIFFYAMIPPPNELSILILLTSVLFFAHSGSAIFLITIRPINNFYELFTELIQV